MFNVSNETKKIGKIIVLNAEGGVGKTTVMGQAVLESGEKGLVVSVGEDGVTSLKNSKGFADLSGINHVTSVIKKWGITPNEAASYKASLASFESGELEKEPTMPEGGLMEFMRWIVKENYSCIGIDSLTKIMAPLREFCLKKDFYDNASAHGKGSGANGYKSKAELTSKAEGFGGSEVLTAMAREWEKLLAGLQYLRSNGVDVYITTHRATKKGRIIGEENEYDYNFVKMDTNKNHDLGGDLFDISDAFLYGKFNTVIANGSKGKGIAVGGDERVFVTEGNATIKAKNRFSMPAEIPATWDELKKYL
jgi:hypothetical protein